MAVAPHDRPRSPSKAPRQLKKASSNCAGSPDLLRVIADQIAQGQDNNETGRCELCSILDDESEYVNYKDDSTNEVWHNRISVQTPSKF